MAGGFIAATVPAKIDHVAGTTLFHLAVIEFGDAMQWVPIAQMNGLTDPWLNGHYDVLIPPTLPGGTPTGILGL
jgi:hypothetical protein